MGYPDLLISDDDTEPSEDESMEDGPLEDEPVETEPFEEEPDELPSTPTTAVAPVETSPVRARRRADASRWDWLPSTLQEWRDEEGIRTTEIEEPSTSVHAPLLRQEPVHHTVPLLATHMVRHEHQISSLQRQFDEESAHLTNQAHGTLHTRLVEAQAVITSLRHHAERSDLRALEYAHRMTALEDIFIQLADTVAVTPFLAPRPNHPPM